MVFSILKITPLSPPPTAMGKSTIVKFVTEKKGRKVVLKDELLRKEKLEELAYWRETQSVIIMALQQELDTSEPDSHLLTKKRRVVLEDSLFYELIQV